MKRHLCFILTCAFVLVGCDSNNDPEVDLWERVAGVELGDTIAEVQAKLGPPSEDGFTLREDPRRSTYSDVGPDGFSRVLVHFQGPDDDTPPGEQRVVMVSAGRSYEAGPRGALGIGSSRARAHELLGAPDAGCPEGLPDLDAYWREDRKLSLVYEGDVLIHIGLWERAYAERHGSWSHC